MLSITAVLFLLLQVKIICCEKGLLTISSASFQHQCVKHIPGDIQKPVKKVTVQPVLHNCAVCIKNESKDCQYSHARDNIDTCFVYAFSDLFKCTF